jgi:hypothetical protein
MRVRRKSTGTMGEATDFNTHGLSEIIVCFDEGDMSSEFVRDYEVLLSTGEWRDMNLAFAANALIPNDMNTSFRESRSDKERARGYY